MKPIALSFLIVMALLAFVSGADEQYTTKYDNVDVEEILRSDRLFNNYYKCLIDQGKCTPDARELKKFLPDALKTGCSKCSEKQRANSDKVLRYILDKKPEEWKVLQAKYDPEGIYYSKYKPEVESRGIKL